VGEGEHGVAFAARSLAQRVGGAVAFSAADGQGASVRAGLVGDPLVADVPVPEGRSLSDEGYALVPEGDGYAVLGGSPPGLMYGLLELRDRLHNGISALEPEVSEPLVGLRGDQVDLPMYLGCDLYDGRWRWHKSKEADPSSWFHDRAGWTARFELYARRRMNTVLFGHPHPFPAFITYPDAPEAAYFDDATVARNCETLQWLIDEGRRYGVRFYFLTWNEWVPRGYAEAHGIPQEGPGTPESAAINRYSYAELYRKFPGLGGLVTMAAESPPGCVEFVRDNVVAPLGQLEHPPEIIFWTWCSYPEDVNTVLGGYPGKTQVQHYLQYEQLFKPMIDPRVGRTSEACGGRPVVILGGLGTATGMLYWSDPLYIRDIMRDVPKQHVGGVFFGGLDSWWPTSDKWIGWEALARYWWDPFREDPPGYWQRRIEDVVGPGYGDDLLSAYTSASAIATRFLCLVHSQSDVFRPQYGIPLVFYLGMPTLSTYVFENHEYIDDKGRLAPRMGLTWPNPDWGEKVVGIVDYVAARQRGERPEGTTPLDIAQELEDHAEATLAAVARLAPLSDNCRLGAKWGIAACDVLSFTAHLGLHEAAKIRAALAWESWRVGAGTPDAVLRYLDESLAEWRLYAGLGAKLYPGEWGTRRNVLTKPFPWTNLDLWRHYAYEPRWTFAQWTKRYERERELVAAALADGRAELPYELDLTTPLEGDVIAGFDGKDAFGGFVINSFPPNATATVENGRLVCDQAGGPTSFYFPMRTDPAACPLERGVMYEMSFRYEVLRAGEDAPPAFSFGARTTEGTWRKDVGARYFFGGAGTAGTIKTQFTPADYDDYYAYISIGASGRIAISDLKLVRARPAHPE